MEKNNQTTTRKYSFCYGHIPYTALFKVFASQDQTTINKTGQELLDGDTTKEITKILAKGIFLIPKGYKKETIAVKRIVVCVIN